MLCVKSHLVAVKMIMTLEMEYYGFRWEDKAVRTDESPGNTEVALGRNVHYQVSSDEGNTQQQESVWDTKADSVNGFFQLHPSLFSCYFLKSAVI